MFNHQYGFPSMLSTECAVLEVPKWIMARQQLISILIFPKLCIHFIWQNPFRLQIMVKTIKTGISGFKPRIIQESIKILISTVVL